MDPKTVYWQDYNCHAKITKLIIDGHLADCKFIVGPEDETAESIYGHKICFIIESPVFETMFSGNYVEAQGKSEIRLNDVTPEDFKNLSYMIYTKSTFILNGLMLNKLLTLYRLCDKYMMTSISQICINHMKNPTYLEKICIDDLITVFEFARELTDKSLLQDTRQIIKKRCKVRTSRTDTLSAKAFIDYVHILRASNLDGYNRPAEKELHIFDVVNSYVVYNNLSEIFINSKQGDVLMENSKKFEITTINSIKSLIGLINFNQMELNDFQNGPGISKMLNFEQKYLIISDIAKKCCCVLPQEKVKLISEDRKIWRGCNHDK